MAQFTASICAISIRCHNIKMAPFKMAQYGAILNGAIYSAI
jgi:hypothetical protein